MVKKRAIVSYDKLSIDQKKGILKDFPDGYVNHLSEIKIPTGEIMEALIWETEDTIYLVKFPKVTKVIAVDDDEDEDDDFDDLDDDAADIKEEDADEADDDTDEVEDLDEEEDDEGE
jgi:hypothetical protein